MKHSVRWRSLARTPLLSALVLTPWAAAAQAPETPSPPTAAEAAAPQPTEPAADAAPPPVADAAAPGSSAPPESEPSGSAPAVIPSAPTQQTEPRPATQEDSNAYEGLSLVDLMNVQVVSTSQRAQDVNQAPATVYVISGHDVRERGYVNLIDVLRDVPGMDPSVTYFSEMGALVSVRGASGNNKIVVLVNGMRVNPPGGEEISFRSDFSVRGAEQIEISYGPGSTLYGQDAIFAVINVITKKPQKGYHFSLSGAYGNNNYKDGFASASGTFGSVDNPVSVQLYAQFIDSDLWDLSKSHATWWKTHYAKATTLGGDPPKRWDRGFNTFMRMEASNSSVQLWFRESSRSSSEGGYSGALYFVDEATWHDRSLAVEGQHRFDLSKRAQLFTTITYNKYEVAPDTRYVFPVGEALFLNDFKYARGTSVQLDERAVIDFTDELSLTAGVVATHYDVTPKATIPGGADPNADIVTQGGAFEYYTAIGDPDSLQRVQRATNLVYQNYGAYAEAQWHVARPLRLIAGLRADKNTRFDEVPISPRLAAIYAVTDRIAAKYVFTQAFVAPAPYYSHNAYDNGADLNAINPALEPERATANELNLTYTDRKLHVGLSAFHLQQRNLLVLGDRGLPANVVADEVYTDLAGTGTRRLVSTANGGKTTTVGADLYAQAHFAYVSPWGSLSVVGSETEVDGQTSGLDQLSTVNVRLGAAVRPLKKLVVTPSLMLRSPLGFTPGTEAGLTRGYEDGETDWPYEVSLHAAYTVLEGLDLFASGRNLTNHRHATKGLLTAAPQEGIRAFGGARYSY